MHGLRPEYQDRINFVILDFDVRAEVEFAAEMGIAAHPAFGLIPPDGGPDDNTAHIFGPMSKTKLRELLDGALAEYAN